MLKHTVCRLCSACCPVEVEVRDGRLAQARRTSTLPPEQRLTCPKLQAAADITYAPERIKHPLIRTAGRDGGQRPADWGEALSLLAERMAYFKRRDGPQSVAWLRGMAADWGAPWDYACRLMHAFGSPNVIGNGSVCHVAREMAHTFTYGAMTVPHAAESRCILVWGKNDRNTCPAAFEAVQMARRRGAALLVVDPVRTPLAEAADLWLQIKPGHDGLLAMAMIAVIIEENLFDRDFVDRWCHGFNDLRRAAQAHAPERVAEALGLEAPLIRRAARLYATTRPACIIDGNGLDMQLQVFDATRAVCMLRALTGNLDRPGGDLIPQPVPTRDLQLRDRLPADRPPVTAAYPLFGAFHPNWGLHAQSALIDAILEERPYPVRMLIVQAGNPAVTMADSARVQRALDKLECLVVIDLFPTRTTQGADLVLPAAGCFEKTQLNRAALRNGPVVLQNRVIPCVGDSWPDWKIIFELGRCLGLTAEFPWHDVEAAIDEQLQPSGITVAALHRHPEGLSAAPFRYEKYRQHGFTTPSGKVEFASRRLADEGYPAVPFATLPDAWLGFADRREEYPFIGISGERSNRYTHSQFRQIAALRQQEPSGYIDMHPDDARELAVEAGDLLRVSTPRGSIRMPARIADRIRPGTILIAWGWDEVDAEAGLNRLTDDTCRNPITATPALRGFRCRVERLRLKRQRPPADCAGQPAGGLIYGRSFDFRQPCDELTPDDDSA